jgi:hypothetical protein
MRFNYKTFGIAAGAAILSLSITACHGQYPGDSAYVPTSTTTLPASQPGGIEPAGAKGQIVSSCGHRLRIIIAAIVNCRFHEKGYGNGTFTVTNDASGIVEVSPSSGTRRTKFTVVGLVVGSGYLLVKDAKGNDFKLRVSVKL